MDDRVRKEQERPKVLTWAWWRPFVYRLFIDLTLLSLIVTLVGIDPRRYITGILLAMGAWLALSFPAMLLLQRRGLAPEDRDVQIGSLLFASRAVALAWVGLDARQIAVVYALGFFWNFATALAWPDGRFSDDQGGEPSGADAGARAGEEGVL